MCRKFRVLYHINDLSIDEVLDYFRRTPKIYGLLAAVNLLLLVLAILNHDATFTIMQLAISIGLYVALLLCFVYARNKPRPSTSVLIVIAVILLLLIALHVISTVFEYNEDHDLTAFIYLAISIAIQAVTIILIYFLHKKIKAERLQNLNEALYMNDDSV